MKQVPAKRLDYTQNYTLPPNEGHGLLILDEATQLVRLLWTSDQSDAETNEDIAKKFKEEYIRCVRNEEECVCNVCLFRCNIFIGVRII